MSNIFAFVRRFLSVLRSIWVRVSPPQALAEGLGIALLILLIFNPLAHDMNQFMLTNVIFFSSVIAGFWLALRARLARGKRFKRIFLEEVLTGLAMGGLATFTGLVFEWTRQDAIFQLSTFKSSLSVIVLGCSALAFYAMRCAVWLLSYWERLRKRNLMWSLTHAHLMVVLMAAVTGVVIMTSYALSTDRFPEVYEQIPPSAQLITRVLTTLLPTVSLYSVLTVMALAILLPPSALFSYIFARQMTRRLQKVIQAAHRLRSGDYSARVPVEGEDEVAQLQGDFNGMAETLERTLEELKSEQARVSHLLQSRRELVASVSHELRTPVATLRGYLDAALDEDPATAPASLREDLEIMRKEAVRLQALIDDLFTLSRAEANGLPLALQPVDLPGLIHERVTAIKLLAWQTGRVEVMADLPANLPPALADPTRLGQVLINLLRNAIRFTPPGGIVAMTAAEEGDFLRIDVRDTGPGIPAEDLPRIWERFYRGTTGNTDPSSGAGLGLALVKELTEAMSGTASVESCPGQGTCFTIRLKKSSA